MTATATRPASRQAHAAPIGAGHLHQALEASRDLARLQSFCASTGCAAAEVSSDGGKSLDVLLVLGAMRRRGYAVGEPFTPQLQPRRDRTTWLVDVALPDGGARLQMGFYTAN